MGIKAENAPPAFEAGTTSLQENEEKRKMQSELMQLQATGGERERLRVEESIRQENQTLLQLQRETLSQTARKTEIDNRIKAIKEEKSRYEAGHEAKVNEARVEIERKSETCQNICEDVLTLRLSVQLGGETSKTLERDLQTAMNKLKNCI